MFGDVAHAIVATVRAEAHGDEPERVGAFGERGETGEPHRSPIMNAAWSQPCW